MENFDDIRAFTEAEFHGQADLLWADPELQTLLQRGLPFPQDLADRLLQEARQAGSLHDFQYGFVRHLLQAFCQAGTDSLESEGFDLLDPGKGYLFVSNHRDIIMDTAQLNLILFGRDMLPSRTAIGSNLLIRPWISRLVRLSESFIVRRELPIKEQIAASRELSAYIRQSICQEGRSVWIAQREGRSKDSTDQTQTGVLKMLTLSGQGSAPANLTELHPVALSISYEYDPCDWLKAKELLLRRDHGDFHKLPQDDLTSMKTGLLGYRGRVFYHASAPLDLSDIDASQPRKELFEALTGRFDREIHAHFHLFPHQYLAADLLEGGTRFSAHYTPAEADRFEQYLQTQLSRIDLPQSEKDLPFLREKLLEMYANPLYNKLNATAR